MSTCCKMVGWVEGQTCFLQYLFLHVGLLNLILFNDVYCISFYLLLIIGCLSTLCKDVKCSNSHCSFIYSITYTECTKHLEHLPNIELHLLLPSDQPQLVGAWTTRCQKRGATGILAHASHSCVKLAGWPLGGGTILDTEGEMLRVKNPAASQFKDT